MFRLVIRHTISVVLSSGLALFTTACDTTSNDDAEDTGPRAWLTHRYELRYVSSDPVPATVFEVRDPDCLKSTVSGGSISFDFPNDGSFKLFLGTRRTPCNREEILDTDGPILDGKYTTANGLLRLTQVEEFVPADANIPWPDFNGTVSSDRNEVSLRLYVNEDLSVFPFLSRSPKGTTLELRFKAHER